MYLPKPKHKPKHKPKPKPKRKPKHKTKPQQQPSQIRIPKDRPATFHLKDGETIKGILQQASRYELLIKTSTPEGNETIILFKHAIDYIEI